MLVLKDKASPPLSSSFHAIYVFLKGSISFLSRASQTSTNFRPPQYLPVILEDHVNMTSRMAQIVAGCAAIFYLLFSLPPVWFIDKVGRRPAMICGAAGLTIVNILLCVGFNIPGTKGTILIVVMYFFYYAAFALSFLNVSWIYPPEINSLKMRSMGASLASCSNWLCKSIRQEPQLLPFCSLLTPSEPT